MHSPCLYKQGQCSGYKSCALQRVMGQIKGAIPEKGIVEFHSHQLMSQITDTLDWWLKDG